jgi:hypothetical protein
MRSAGPLALLLFCLTTQAVADPRTDVLSTAARCNAIADYRVWLDCYYGAAQSMRALLGLAPAPAGQVGLVPPAGAAQPPAPVASAARPAPALPPEAYEDYRPRQKMASYSFDAEHLFTVTLEDGSVWQQSAEDFVRARWAAPAGSYYASVTRGSFGSHLLKVSDKHSYRVKRVR